MGEKGKPPIMDEQLVKEMELVRLTVIQLEAEIEKYGHEYKDQLNKQTEALEHELRLLQTKYNQLQAQLIQEVKSKDQMT
jgi:hypothetical protein